MPTGPCSGVITIPGRRTRVVTLPGRGTRVVTLPGRGTWVVTLPGRGTRVVTLPGRGTRVVTLPWTRVAGCRGGRTPNIARRPPPVTQSCARQRVVAPTNQMEREGGATRERDAAHGTAPLVAGGGPRGAPVAPAPAPRPRGAAPLTHQRRAGTRRQHVKATRLSPREPPATVLAAIAVGARAPHPRCLPTGVAAGGERRHHHHSTVRDATALQRRHRTATCQQQAELLIRSKKQRTFLVLVLQESSNFSM